MFKQLSNFILKKTMLTVAVALLASGGWVYAYPKTVDLTPEPEGNASLQQTKITVTGTVSDSDGPIIGASVLEKGQSANGTVTNADGEFSLNVAPNATLVITYIGYATQEIAVNGKTSFTITLSEQAGLLDEVVVVGYGTQKKVNLTGSVDQVNFSDQALSRPITSVSSALSGLMSGVSVMQTSSRPGEDGATIRIRGNGTLNDNSPLIIVDGMEAPSMDVVAPQDIESISVLKDAASGAIYGSRAANGVILVTTKKGKTGKVNINYTGMLSWTKPTNLIELTNDYASYMEYMNEGYINTGKPQQFKDETIALWREKSKNPNATDTPSGVPNYVAYPNTDWQRVLFKGDALKEHNLSLTGASEKSRYTMSVGFLDNPGLVENTGIKKLSLRSNLESDITKWLTVGMNIYGFQQDKDVGNFDNANNYLRQTTPGVYPRWNGVAGGPEAAEENPMANSLFTFLNGANGLNKQTRYSVTGTARIKPLKGLIWELNANYRRRLDENRTYTNAQNAKKIRFSDNYIFAPTTALNDMTSYFYHYGNYFYTLENLLRYNTTINEIHDIGALAGYQETYYYEYSNGATKKGFMAENLYVPDRVTDMQSIGGSALDRATRSFFGRINYAYKSKYLFEANIRLDASSRYSKEHRWGTFPSVSAAWRMTEENFMENIRKTFDNIKVRASYGQLGNTGGDNVGNYEYQATYGGANYPLGNALQPGFYINVWPNLKLSWETTTVSNLGIDVNMLKNKLNVVIDIYDKYTHGILYTPTIPNMAQGASAPRMNIAEVDNKGIELSVGWNDRKGDFSYSVSANVAYNHNQVAKYKGAYVAGWVENPDGTKTWKTNLSEVSTGSALRIVEGRPINEIYLKTVYSGDGTYFNSDGTPNPKGGPKDGMIRTEKDMEWLREMINAKDENGKKLYTFFPNNDVSKTKIWYGDIIYADNNGDGKFGDEDDNIFHGISDKPKYNYGMQLSAQWKGIDISMNWAGCAGFNLYWAPTSGYNSTGLRLGLAVPAELAKNHYFYDPENPNDPRTNINAKYGRFVEGESGYQIHQSSAYYMYKGDFLKLKNLTIGYTVPQNISRKAYIEKLRIFATGENLLNFTSFPGQDPEMGVTPSYVSMRQLAIGLNVSF